MINVLLYVDEEIQILASLLEDEVSDFSLRFRLRDSSFINYSLNMYGFYAEHKIRYSEDFLLLLFWTLTKPHWLNQWCEFGVELSS